MLKIGNTLKGASDRVVIWCFGRVQGPDSVESDLTGVSVPLEHSFEVGEFRLGVTVRWGVKRLRILWECSQI